MADGAGSEKADLEAELRDLYAVEPSEFVAARTELVRRLRTAKRREEAAEVAKRRRPSPAAWALDRVAGQQPELVEQALAAGARLRVASEAAMAGDAAGLRRATAEDRAASDAVVDAALHHLGGRGAATRPQLAATLRAAVLDEEVAAELRRGVLAADHEAPGFGWSGLEELPEPPSAPPVDDGGKPRPQRKAPAGRGRPRRAGTETEADDEAGAEAEAEAEAETEPAAAGKAGGEAETNDKGGARAAAEAERRREAARQRERDEQERRARLEAELAALEEEAARLARAAEEAEAEALRARAAADTADEAARAARDELRRPVGN